MSAKSVNLFQNKTEVLSAIISVLLQLIWDKNDVTCSANMFSCPDPVVQVYHNIFFLHIISRKYIKNVQIVNIFSVEISISHIK